MSDSDFADPVSPASSAPQPVDEQAVEEHPVENLSPRKSIRRIHQDLRCFVISSQYEDTKACHNAISRTLQALFKHSELDSSIKQARK